jgi:hypothetical protein
VPDFTAGNEPQLNASREDDRSAMSEDPEALLVYGYDFGDPLNEWRVAGLAEAVRSWVGGPG